MALIDKIKAIADAIRSKTGSTGLMTIDEMPEMIELIDAGSGDVSTLDNTYILVDENGHELAAVLTEEEVELTANPVTDIRAGVTAVTDEGVVTGEKEIPAYYVSDGVRVIPSGSNFAVRISQGRYRYTKLQTLFCKFNSSLSNSTATDRVAIEDKVYAVNSTESISTITLDENTESIVFGLTNDSDTPYIIRYFTYKEE